ncbi:MAG: hypothetical protein ACOVOD_09685, partial [Rhodoferax sp.]
MVMFMFMFMFKVPVDTLEVTDCGSNPVVHGALLAYSTPGQHGVPRRWDGLHASWLRAWSGSLRAAALGVGFLKAFTMTTRAANHAGQTRGLRLSGQRQAPYIARR